LRYLLIKVFRNNQNFHDIIYLDSSYTLSLILEI